MESVRVRYRRADGEFVDSTLERVTVRELADGLPVREFRCFKGRRHYSGWYWSATVERLVAYESLLELDRILLADHDCEVTAIAAQPFQLIGPDRERTRRHVPDLLLLTRDGGVSVVDVKAASRLDDPTVVAVFAWTRALIGQRGWGFEVWSGAHRYVVDNVRFLAGYRRSTLIAAELIPTVLDTAVGRGSLREIEAALSDRYPSLLVRPVVLHLLWTGMLRADLSRPLSVDTPVCCGEVAGR